MCKGLGETARQPENGASIAGGAAASERCVLLTGASKALPRPCLKETPLRGATISAALEWHLITFSGDGHWSRPRNKVAINGNVIQFYVDISVIPLQQCMKRCAV